MTTAFDHRDAGTPEHAWLSHPALTRLPLLQIPQQGTHVVVLAAHPDDETLGAGGLLAAAAAAGASIEVIIASNGEASHPHSPTHSPSQLSGIRKSEARRAVSSLAGSAIVTFLNLPDGELPRYQRVLAVALEQRLRPGSLLISPWRGDRHPDHEACAFAARAVLRRHPDCAHWQYPIWAWHWAAPAATEVDSALPWPMMWRLDLTADQRTGKQQAMMCYRSQHQALSPQPGDEPILPAAVLAHFDRTFETFVVEPAHAAGDSSYFDDLYAAAEDPWGLADRFYEQRKRELLLTCLPRPRFRRAFEPGCATGLLTERLAARCDALLSCDAAARAVRLAGDRLAGTSNATVFRAAIPEEWPDGRFDLIVLSEVGYYCDDLEALTARIGASLTADGVLVACHWRHPAPDHPHSAAAVHATLEGVLRPVVHHVEDDFLLDVWSVTGTSVAESEGLLG